MKVEVEIERSSRSLLVYDMDIKVAPGCPRPVKYRIPLEELVDILERYKQLRELVGGYGK